MLATEEAGRLAGLIGLEVEAGLTLPAGKLPLPAATLLRYCNLPPHCRPKFWVLFRVVEITRTSMKTCRSGVSRLTMRSRSFERVSASPEAKRELVTRIHWRELTALRRFWLPVAVPVPKSVAICLRA